MSEPTDIHAERIRLVRQWLEKARRDWDVCELLMEPPHGAPVFSAVCFHAQQCVEKLLKAVLVWRDIDFRKTHDIQVLMKLLAEGDRPNLSDAEQRALTAYAVDSRYELDMIFTKTMAAGALDAARKTREFVVPRIEGEVER